jgi:AcrR family transcriptional regulator
MGDIASAAGVVRRTVYGHFPSRPDLVRITSLLMLGVPEPRALALAGDQP